MNLAYSAQQEVCGWGGGVKFDKYRAGSLSVENSSNYQNQNFKQNIQFSLCLIKKLKRGGT